MIPFAIRTKYRVLSEKDTNKPPYCVRQSPRHHFTVAQHPTTFPKPFKSLTS